MKPARLIVLAIALGAAGTAGVLMMNGSAPPPPTVIERKVEVSTKDVLAAVADLGVGATIKPGDVRWQPWPAEFVPAGAITRADAPGALEEVTGSLVRSNFLTGEPIRRERLIKANGSGFMSAILPSGMRAIAIAIDTRGASSAGGFILPNDHVDVLRIARDEEATKVGAAETQTAETILSNVRVLAIGQNVQEKNGEKVITGETATLEVTSGQAEAVALAQKVGQLSLVLRSLRDANVTETTRDESDKGMVVVRYGVARQASRK